MQLLLIWNKKKPECISPTLASNHWLPVCFRIDLKIPLFLNVVMARLHDWHAPSLWRLLGRGLGLEGTTPSQLLHQNCGIRWDEYSVQPSNSKEKSTLKCVCYGFSILQPVDLHSICGILASAVIVTCVLQRCNLSLLCLCFYQHCPLCFIVVLHIYKKHETD